MPGMDGFETADLIRERERSRYTPIIFLTAYDRSEAAGRPGVRRRGGGLPVQADRAGDPAVEGGGVRRAVPEDRGGEAAGRAAAREPSSARWSSSWPPSGSGGSRSGCARRWPASGSSPAELPRRAEELAAGEGSGGGGQPGQEPVPGEHEPRAAHAAQRDHRLLRDAPGGGRGPGRADASSRTSRRSTRPASTCSG